VKFTNHSAWNWLLALTSLSWTSYDSLLWLTAVKNVMAGWVFNFRVRVLLKTAVNVSFEWRPVIVRFACILNLCALSSSVVSVRGRLHHEFQPCYPRWDFSSASRTNLLKKTFAVCSYMKRVSARAEFRPGWNFQPGLLSYGLKNLMYWHSFQPGLKYDLGHAHRLSCECKTHSCKRFPSNFEHCTQAEICHVIAPLVCQVNFMRELYVTSDVS